MRNEISSEYDMNVLIILQWTAYNLLLSIMYLYEQYMYNVRVHSTLFLFVLRMNKMQYKKNLTQQNMFFNWPFAVR